MNREEFLQQLKNRLSQLPSEEIEERLDYYNEIIDDMLEDGISEEETIESFGDIGEIAQKIMQEVPLTTLMKSKVKPRKGWSPTAIVIAAIGSPLWIPLLLAFAAVMASVYVTIWFTIIAMFAAVISLGIGGGYLFIIAFTMFSYGIGDVLMTFGIGIGLMGLCLLGFLASKIISAKLIILTRWILKQIKNLFIRKSSKTLEGEAA